MKRKFKDPKAVIKSLVAATLGVFTYCLVIAPLFKEGSYTSTASDTLREVGWGMVFAILLIGAVWLVVLSVIRNRNGESG